MWQGLSQWVEAHGMQLSLAVLQEAGDGSAGAPAVWCMGELGQVSQARRQPNKLLPTDSLETSRAAPGGQNTAFEGPLELEPLKLFVAQV